MRAGPLLAAALLVATASPLALGYVGTRTAYVVAGSDVAAVGRVGLAACQDAANVAVLHCGAAAVAGAAFMDVGCAATFSAPGCLDDVGPLVDDFASGTCAVAFPPLPPAPVYSFVCAVDRDDDGAIMARGVPGVQAAAATDALGDPWSSDPDGFDDDLAIGAGAAPAAFCFRRDRAVAGSPLDPLPMGDWDEVDVFVQVNVPATTMPVGLATVTLTAVSGAACAPAGTLVSGHTHATYKP